MNMFQNQINDSDTEPSELALLSLGYIKEYIEADELLAKNEPLVSENLEYLKALLFKKDKFEVDLQGVYKQIKIKEEELQVNLHLLQQTDLFLEILDAPQLIDSCVRNNMFSEALDARARVLHILNYFQHFFSSQEKENSKLLTLILEDVLKISENLKKTVFQLLKSKTNLIESLRLTGILRRFYKQNQELFTPNEDGEVAESNIMKGFLEAKFDYLSDCINNEVAENSYQIFCNRIRVSQELFPEILIQFNSIFLDGTSIFEFSFLSNSFIDSFIADLENVLASLSELVDILNIFELTIAFANDCAMCGADFQPLVFPIFLNRLRLSFRLYWEECFSLAKQSIEDGNWGFNNNPVQNPQAAEYAPPESCSKIAVLGELINNLFISFNELRKCLNPSLRKLLRSDLVLLCGKVDESLMKYKQMRSDVVFDQMKVKYKELSEAVRKEMIPFILKVFDELFKEV